MRDLVTYGWVTVVQQLVVSSFLELSDLVTVPGGHHAFSSTLDARFSTPVPAAHDGSHGSNFYSPACSAIFSDWRLCWPSGILFLNNISA
jgi:hypothetical protein